MMSRIERGLPGCYGLSALSGVLLAASYAMHPFWWAAWLAPAPVLAATLIAPRPARRRLTLLAGLIAGSTSFSYHATVGDWFVAILILALVAIAWSHAVRLAVDLADRKRALLAVLTIPVIWAAIDTLLIHVSPHSSAGGIAYSQMDALPVIQVASLGGVPAVTFVILLPGSLLGLLLARGIEIRRPGMIAASAIVIAVVGATLMFGTMRLRGAATTPGSRVALIATDGIQAQPRSWDAFRQAYGRVIARVAWPDTIVLLPEGVMRLSARSAERAAQSLASYAARRRATIVVGVIVEAAGGLTNRALVAQPDGTHLWYLKQHLVPGVEAGITPGSQPLVLPTSGVGVAICKDMHFPTLGRDYARRGAQLILVPANDFEVDDWLTARMTIMRGVEAGSPIARAARHGISFVSDRYGRITIERRSDSAMGVLVTRVPADPGDTTYYAMIGDAFGWACVLAWSALLLLRGRRLHRKRKNDDC